MTVRSDAAPAVSLEDFEKYRRELTGYCYRMLGSSFEAEDAVQETMVRAWKSMDSFEGRSSARSWLYRIATNVSLDMLRGRQRRAQPMDMGPAHSVDTPVTETLLAENVWLSPIQDDRIVPEGADPAEVAVARDTVRLAFVAALQFLPARQRAVLILREVLGWPAAEVARLLETTVASVNSALQRARATLTERDVTVRSPVAADQEELLRNYVDAFERYDMTKLVSLLHEDAVLAMPPFALWLRGRENVRGWFLGQGIVCQGSKIVVVEANGSPAFATFHREPDGSYVAWAIQVLETDGERVTAQHSFVDPKLFAQFGLPETLPAD